MGSVVEMTPRRQDIFRKGQIKMSAYMNFGLLTVHVVQARHLSSKWRKQAHSYVLVSIVPDDTNTARCRTAIVKETNSPSFSEKFSFELGEEDMTKRLLISVWHRDPQSGMQEFLGCTSFGLRHLKRAEKEVNGWYHLLTEDVGCLKHLQIVTRQRHPQTQTDPKPVYQPPPQPQIPSVNKDIRGLEHRDITVHRGKNGFGFTLVDSCPVKVSKVDGVCLRENNEKIRECHNQSSQPSCRAPSGPRHEKTCFRGFRPASRAEQSGLRSGDLIIRVNGQNVSRSTSVSVAKIIKKCGSRVTLEIQRPSPTCNSQKVICMNPNSPGSKSSDQSSCASVQELSIHDDRAFLLNQTNFSVDTRRQAALHRLLCLEENFIEMMHSGIQKFSRPLRHCLLSTSQHEKLFQNVEKLVSIAEYQLHQIQMTLPTHSLSDDKSDTDNQDLTYSVGMIYYSKLQILIQAYSLYVSGLSSASKLLSHLERSEEFRHFIRNSQGSGSQMSLSEFINRPVHHFQDLCGILTTILDATPSRSQEREVFFAVVQGLQQIVSLIEFCPMPFPAPIQPAGRRPFPRMGASALSRSRSLNSDTSSSSGFGTGSGSSQHSDGRMCSTELDSALDMAIYSMESVIF